MAEAARLPNAVAAIVDAQGRPTPEFFRWMLRVDTRVLVGSGASQIEILAGEDFPTMNAPKGSLYIHVNGFDGETRFYINVNGFDTWTYVLTAT